MSGPMKTDFASLPALSIVLLFLIILSPIIVGITSCQRQYLPKPKGYNRIDLPAHEYKILPDTLPYSFQYSVHSDIYPDSSWMAEKYWFTLFYPEFESFVQVTYKPVLGKQQLLQEYLNDAYNLAAKHQVKAYSIEESLAITPTGKTAIMLELSGEVPSQFQFFITDSVNHFLRAALYFNTATKNDSLGPVIEYMKVDMVQMINSLEWKPHLASSLKPTHTPSP